MNQSSPDNFQKFLAQNPDYSGDLHIIMRSIAAIKDPVLQKKTRDRINVELGVILLEKREISASLQHLLELNFDPENSFD